MLFNTNAHYGMDRDNRCDRELHGSLRTYDNNNDDVNN